MRRSVMTWTPLTCLLILTTSGWGCDRDNPQSAAPTLARLELGAIHNLSTFGDIYLAGQPGVKDFALLEHRGVKTVVNLRQPDEMTNLPEQNIVAKLGMTYHQFPTRGPETFTDELFDQVRNLLRDPANRPILLHCGSANRVGPVWIVYRVLESGAPFDEAVEEARAVGLQHEPYIEVARSYIEKRVDKDSRKTK